MRPMHSQIQRIIVEIEVNLGKIFSKGIIVRLPTAVPIGNVKAMYEAS